MGFDLLEPASNVVRFPIERRVKPSVELLYDVAPNVLDVSLLAKSFGIELVTDGRETKDRAMAEYIVDTYGSEFSATERPGLDRLLKYFLGRAVDACARAHEASRAARSARELWIRAQAEGGYWLSQVEARATSRLEEAANLYVKAYHLSEEAFGAARAIGMAKRGEVWRPSDASRDMEWLCDEHRKHAKKRGKKRAKT